jgi:hypothetical protein
MVDFTKALARESGDQRLYSADGSSEAWRREIVRQLDVEEDSEAESSMHEMLQNSHNVEA